MAVSGTRVTVGDTPVRLDTSATTRGLSARGRILVINPAGSGVTVDLGGPAVTSGGGIELLPGGETPVLDLHEEDGLYAIAPSGTVDLQVLELGPGL